MDASKLRHLRDVEEENAKLKRLLADAMLDNAGLKEVFKKTSDARKALRSLPSDATSGHGALNLWVFK